jgi:hypothetical protein
MLPKLRMRPQTFILLNRFVLNIADDNFKIDFEGIGYLYFNFKLVMKSGSFKRRLCLAAIHMWNFLAESHWSYLQSSNRYLNRDFMLPPCYSLIYRRMTSTDLHIFHRYITAHIFRTILQVQPMLLPSQKFTNCVQIC